MYNESLSVNWYKSRLSSVTMPQTSTKCVINNVVYHNRQASPTCLGACLLQHTTTGRFRSIRRTFTLHALAWHSNFRHSRTWISTFRSGQWFESDIWFYHPRAIKDTSQYHQPVSWLQFLSLHDFCITLRSILNTFMTHYNAVSKPDPHSQGLVALGFYKMLLLNLGAKNNSRRQESNSSDLACCKSDLHFRNMLCSHNVQVSSTYDKMHRAT